MDGILESIAPMVVAEYLFIEVAEQMEWLDTDIGSTEAALEQTPEVLKPIGVNLSANVAFRMVNDLMGEVRFQSFVGQQLVGIERRAGADVFPDDLVNLWSPTSLHHFRPDVSATFQHADHDCLLADAHLVLTLPKMDIPCVRPNEGFVCFAIATTAAELASEGFVLHGESDAVQHEPCRLLSDPDSPRHLIAADTVAAVDQHPDSGEPLIKRDGGILKDGSYFGGELPLGVDALALPLPLILEEHHVFASAGWTGDFAIGPAESDHVPESTVRVSKVDDCGLQGSGLLVVFHALNTRA